MTATTDRTDVPRLAAVPPVVPTWRYLGFVLGPGLGTFAFNSVTVTLPQVHRDLGASDAQLELVVAGYGIPFAVLLILGGRLGDRYGRHRLFAIGMTLLLVAALAGSAAPTIGTLVAARVVQGIGAALCTPQVLATIQATSTGASRVRAISAFSASGGIGAAAGQVVGGALASATIAGVAGWRAAYWVTAIIAVVAIALSGLAPHSRAHEAVAIDVAGTVELGAGILLVASALTFGPSTGWSWPVLVALVVGVAALVALWVHQNHIERAGRVPLLPPSILRLRPLQLGLLAACLFFVGYAALLFVVPRALESGLGVSPLGAGMVLLPFAVVFAAVSLCLTPIQRRLGDATLLWGVSIQALALVAVAVTLVVGWSPALPLLLQPALVLLGVGQALVFAPLTQVVVREIPVEAAGLSGGLFSTVQQLSLAVGVIAIGGITSATGWSGQGEFVAGTVLDIGVVAVVLGLAAVLVRRPR